MALFRAYKPGQGRYARITSGVLLALLSAYGCRSLSWVLADAGAMPTFLGVTVTWAQVVPVAVFFVVMAAGVYALNHPRVADFLIETETEMGKVNWPSRRTVVASSVVVIVVVLIMAGCLYGIDRFFLVILEQIGLY